MLRRMGIREAAEQRKAVVALQESGVISARPNRSAIAKFKETAVKEALQTHFFWHCRRGDCTTDSIESGKPLLLVDGESCGASSHSPRQALLSELGDALQERGIGKILLVGGTQEYWQEISSSSPKALNWRFVDGKKAKDERFYRPHKDWADLIVIWASTPLNHKVSKKFPSAGDRRVVTAAGRGIEAMARDVLDMLAVN